MGGTIKPDCTPSGDKDRLSDYLASYHTQHVQSVDELEKHRLEQNKIHSSISMAVSTAFIAGIITIIRSPGGATSWNWVGIAGVVSLGASVIMHFLQIFFGTLDTGQLLRKARAKYDALMQCRDYIDINATLEKAGKEIWRYKGVCAFLFMTLNICICVGIAFSITFFSLNLRNIAGGRMTDQNRSDLVQVPTVPKPQPTTNTEVEHSTKIEKRDGNVITRDELPPPPPRKPK